MKVIPIDNSLSIATLTDDPYPHYAQMRRESPLLEIPAIGRVVVTKAVHAKYIKENPALFSSDDPTTPMERAFLAKTLMRRDGEDHMQLRRAMTPAFTARNIREVWTPCFRNVVHAYVDRLDTSGPVDLFTQLAAPVAARCLAHLLGLTNASDEDLIFWSQALIDGAGNFGWLPGPFEVSDRANAQMTDCFEAARAAKMATPDTSVMSVQLHAERPIDWADMVSNLKIAIGGGINEPRDAALTAIYGVLTNPRQRQALVDGTVSWGVALEEAIRWVAPIQATSRVVKEDTNIDGFHVPAGTVLLVSKASANRDEDVFDHGERFDIFREKKPHQAFGNGPHFCMGTHVARMLIGEHLLPYLFERFPNMVLDPDTPVQWRGFGFRGPIGLSVLLIP